MYKSIVIALLLLVNTAYVSAESSDLSPLDILQRAEKQRSPWLHMVLQVDLETEKKGKRSKEKYKVYFKDNIKTLISFIEPAFEKDIWY